MDYAPIDSYGLIGNMRTAALVSEDGSVDWLCLPQFDSPSIFAAILDHRRGGRFQIMASAIRLTTWRYYIPDTNVLVTRFRSDAGIGEVIDFMPAAFSRHDRFRPDLVRIVRVEQGSMTFEMRCQPAFNYARDQHTVREVNGCVFFESGAARCVLSSTAQVRVDGCGVFAELHIHAGQMHVFALTHALEHSDQLCQVTSEEGSDLMHDTIAYWRNWISACTYAGRWRERVRRSALVLKLLTFEPTGAIVAAPTTSLPEHLGGTRNWDYRYTWIRDSVFIVDALLRIGLVSETARFIQWVNRRFDELEPDGMLRPLYGIDGRHELPEEQLTHLEGYGGSAPVRIGNDAYRQLQLDAPGTLMEAISLHDELAAPLSYETWRNVLRLLHWVCENWQRDDHGIWEVRGSPRQFIHSKLMCWVALQRGLLLAERRGFPSELERWRTTRDQIYTHIMERGWNKQIEAFVQYEGSDKLDASILRMPLVGFISPNDPRMLKTIRAMHRQPSEGGLVSDLEVRRYQPEFTDDGLNEPEGAFNMCTFWLIAALTQASRMDRSLLEQARLMFDRMLEYSGPLGLYAEQTGWNGEALGNYPQGLTHLSLITAATGLDRVLDARQR